MTDYTAPGLISLSGVSVNNGPLGQPGSSISWTGGSPQASTNTVTDVNGDGNLDVGTDAVNGTAIVFSGYTITLNGKEFPVFNQPGQSGFYVITDQTSNSFFTAPGTSNVFQDNAAVYMCFFAGTQISTPRGESTVETLAIGDLINTEDGNAVPVKWIGRQTVKTMFGTDERTRPVRFAAGSLGHGLPHSDLTVTADHGMLLNGYVINASALVNGTTIDFVPLAQLGESFTVYHVETENHDVIRANGAPTETFVDAATRSTFDNFQDYLDLYGAERIIPEMQTPRISTQRLLPDAIKAQLGIASPMPDQAWTQARA